MVLQTVSSEANFNFYCTVERRLFLSSLLRGISERNCPGRCKIKIDARETRDETRRDERTSIYAEYLIR